MNRKSHLRNSFSLMKTCYNEMRQNVPGYISWEMTPTSIGGEMNCHLLHSAIVGM